MPDPEVLRRCLRLLRAAAAAGEAEPWQVAFLVDRVSLVERNVQVVETTICRQAGGSFGPPLLENPEQVDARRRAAGLPPLEQDIRRIEQFFSGNQRGSDVFRSHSAVEPAGHLGCRTGARPGVSGGRCAMAGPATLRPPPPRAPRWHRMLAVVVLLAATGCSGAADSPSSSRSTQPPPAPTSATVPTFDRSRFAAVIPLPSAASMTLADGMLWVRKGAGTVVRVDPATNQVVGKPLRVRADAEAIAVGQGARWVARVAPGDLGAPLDDAVTRIDLASGRMVATITVRRGPLDLAVTPGAVWVTNSGGGGDSVARIDPQTNRLAGRPVSTGTSPQSLAVGGGSLWVANHDARTVTRIDPASGKVVADIPVPSEPHRVAYGAGAAWVGNWHDNSVSRIDPATNRVVGSPIPIGFHHAGNLVVGAGSVWVTSDYRVDAAAEDVVVVRIDPQANRAVETIEVGGHPIDVAATGGAVWVSVADPGRVLRIAAS
jgi:YVTN family beta-propeller protein